MAHPPLDPALTDLLQGLRSSLCEMTAHIERFLAMGDRHEFPVTAVTLPAYAEFQDDQPPANRPGVDFGLVEMLAWGPASWKDNACCYPHPRVNGWIELRQFGEELPLTHVFVETYAQPGPTAQGSDSYARMSHLFVPRHLASGLHDLGLEYADTSQPILYRAATQRWRDLAILRLEHSKAAEADHG